MTKKKIIPNRTTKPALTHKVKRFIEEYLTDFNGSRSALAAGYSFRSHRSIANELLKKPHIRKIIDERMAEMSMSANEVTKRIGDIAKSSLNDYFIIEEEIYRPQILAPVADVIRGIEADIEDEEELFKLLPKKSKKQIIAHRAAQEERRTEILRLKVKLKRNPAAKMAAQGEPQLRKVARLDLARLVADRAAGRIKSVKPTEHGMNVELYAADAALRDLARVHGLFKDNLKVDAADELKNLYKTVMKRAN